jgi:hypothetical protein
MFPNINGDSGYEIYTLCTTERKEEIVETNETLFI